MVKLIIKTADSINKFAGSLKELEAEVIKEVKSHPGPYKQHEVDMFTISTCSKLKSRIINCDRFKEIVNGELKKDNKIIR
jgi:hypothetical protein